MYCFLQNYDKRNRCIYAITAVATARMLYEVHLDNNIGEVLHCIEEALKKCQVIMEDYEQNCSEHGQSCDRKHLQIIKKYTTVSAP